MPVPHLPQTSSPVSNGGEEQLSILTDEAALVRIVNAYADFSDLVSGSQTPMEKTKTTINADGHKTFEMTLGWSNIRTFAPLLREREEGVSLRQTPSH